MQRILDLIFSSLTIIFFSPVLIIIVILLKITGEGEVFYRQIRVGKNGIPFKLLKFATMLKDSPNIGSGEITISNDPRVLPIGKFLRKSKINELPQLLNIFLGHMSIVGPRPLSVLHYNRDRAQGNVTRYLLRGGLLGLGHVNKGTPEMGNPVYEYEYVKQYLKRSSFGLLMLDLRIIWRGILLIVKGGGH